MRKHDFKRFNNCRTIFYECPKCNCLTKCVEINKNIYDILPEKYYINRKIYCRQCGNKILEDNKNI